jgi:4-hydroxybenzoate polyprenyltransferase
MAVTAREALPPLCVDLDGTLILSDLLLESLLRLVARNPLYIFMIPWWLLRGRAALKAEIAARVDIDPAALPYDVDLLQWLKSEGVSQRRLWLCTATHERLAQQVAKHLGIFEGVLASNAGINLAGRSKARRLVEQFGERGFDYCGNERRDLAIWQHARGAVVVHGSSRLEEQAAQVTEVLRTFPSQVHPWALVRALRPHQWAKNLLVLVPLLGAHRLNDMAALRPVLLGFTAFCLCASSVYVLNDLLDLDADRAHPRKSRRPFASGAAPLAAGMIMAPSLLAAAALLATMMPLKFQLVFVTYYGLTLAYSLFLKGQVLIDTLVLAGLYTLRLVAGAAAAGLPLSFWLLLFSVFLFLSLAFVKRYAELDNLRRRQLLKAAGRGYHIEDLSILRSLGAAAGYLSVLVLALYINSPEVQVLYHRPKVIWFLCITLLYWISRIWVIAERGNLHDDPVVYALKDRMSLLTGFAAVVTVVMAM